MRRRRPAPALSIWTLLRLPARELAAQLGSSASERRRILEAAAHAGVPSAQVHLGQMLLEGQDAAPDAAAAFRWFKRAADLGSMDGLNMVGRCHELGWGVPIDAPEAARCYRIAAEAGHDWAQFNLGMLVLSTSEPQALAWFRRAAGHGNAKAMNMLGRFNEEGWAGLPPDDALACAWYARAAEGGCFRGQFHLARFVAAAGDTGGAARLLRSSAETAPPDFCRDLARALRNRPEPAFRRIARFALLRSCGTGDASDLHAYALALLDGLGGPADPEAALPFLEKAAAGGRDAARDIARARSMLAPPPIGFLRRVAGWLQGTKRRNTPTKTPALAAVRTRLVRSRNRRLKNST